MTKRGQRRFRHRQRINPAPPIQVVHIFDTFTLESLRKGPRIKDEVLRFAWDHYSALQHQRSAVAEEITEALALARIGPFPFSRWMRVVDYQFTNHPLSAAGSVKSMAGGRFNIGDIDPIKFAPFPALYLASDHETVLAETLEQPTESARRRSPAISSGDQRSAEKVSSGSCT